jgi:hypothetical protein
MLLLILFKIQFNLLLLIELYLKELMNSLKALVLARIFHSDRDKEESKVKIDIF